MYRNGSSHGKDQAVVGRILHLLPYRSNCLIPIVEGKLSKGQSKKQKYLIKEVSTIASRMPSNNFVGGEEFFIFTPNPFKRFRETQSINFFRREDVDVS